MAEKKKKNNDGEMSFLEHLEELRWVFLHSIIAVFVCMVVAFCFKNFMFDVVLLGPSHADFWTNRLLCDFGHRLGKDLCINSEGFNLISIKMAGQLTVHFAVAMVAGVVLAVPYIVYQFWSFLKPALLENEKDKSRGAVLVISGLFLLGVLFGYFFLSPLSIHFLVSYDISASVENQINIRSYIGTISSICLSCGIIFELPVLAYFLTKIGILTPEFMKKYRRHAVVVIIILAAFITPPDIFSQCLIAIPLLCLYEISIGISKRVVKNKEKAHDDFMNAETTDVAIKD